MYVMDCGQFKLFVKLGGFKAIVVDVVAQTQDKKFDAIQKFHEAHAKRVTKANVDSFLNEQQIFTLAIIMFGTHSEPLAAIKKSILKKHCQHIGCMKNLKNAHQFL